MKLEEVSAEEQAPTLLSVSYGDPPGHRCMMEFRPAPGVDYKKRTFCRASAMCPRWT